MRTVLLFVYYAFAQYLPSRPVPGYWISQRFRAFLVKKIIRSCGTDIVVKNKAYFGNGERLRVGCRSALGINSRLNGKITLGEDVMMGPDVLIMATSHNHDRTDIPINKQGHAEEKEVVIGDGVWIGARVVILPGVKVGDHSIISAGSVVSRSFPAYSVIAGSPARLASRRNSG